MPHVPMPVFSSPFGLACPAFGPKAPMFICSMCGTPHMMYLPGQQINPGQMRQMGARGIAPVIQANQHANNSQLSNMMREAMTSFAKSAGSSLGDQFGDYLGGYFFGDQSY